MGLGSFKVTGSDTIRKLEYGFLVMFHGNYGFILHHYGDHKARYWSKIAIFLYPSAFDVPIRRVPVPVGKFTPRLVRKTRMVWLPDGEKTF